MQNSTFKQRLTIICKDFIYDPKKLIRFVILFACSIVVVFQLSECFWKLIHPPITTHSHFDLNDSMSYPAITFCRNPPYKEDVLQDYNLSSSHPQFSIAWRYFPFETTDLDEMFWNATYNKNEYFGQYGLYGYRHNVKVINSMNLKLGQCQTFVPLISTRGSWKEYGYSLLLHHTLNKTDIINGQYPPGWHVYIHDPRENFTENTMQLSGRVEYMYITVGEEVDVKLSVQHFHMMKNHDALCSSEPGYSAIECGKLCQWRQVTDAANCSGPWMINTGVPYCSNYSQMRELLSIYDSLENNTVDCICVESCESTIYSAYVMNRVEFNQPTPSSQVYLYYSSKMVSIIEERPGYDLSQFVADMGGSLGFLLGLSVLGLIGILEKLAHLLFGGRFTKCNKNNNGNNNNMNNSNHEQMNEVVQIKSQPIRKISSDHYNSETTAEVPAISLNKQR